MMDQAEDEETAAVLAIDCPWCGEPAGSWCKSTGGHIFYEATKQHSARRLKAGTRPATNGQILRAMGVKIGKRYR